MSATVAYAHPYASATSSSHIAPSTSRPSRRASYQAPPPLPLATSLINMPLPPTPHSPTSSMHSVVPPPAYSRRDKPGAETRVAKVDRTAHWVAAQQAADVPAVVDAPSLQSYGYFSTLSTEPPTYTTSPTSPSNKRDSQAVTRAHDPDYRRAQADIPSGVMGRALARSMAEEKKTANPSRAAKPASTNKAKSVFRKLVGGRSEDVGGSYMHIDDDTSYLHT